MNLLGAFRSSGVLNRNPKKILFRFFDIFRMDIVLFPLHAISHCECRGMDVGGVGCQRGGMSAWRILPSLLQQLVDVVDIVERVVEEEAQLGDDAQLVAHTLA